MCLVLTENESPDEALPAVRFCRLVWCEVQVRDKRTPRALAGGCAVRLGQDRRCSCGCTKSLTSRLRACRVEACRLGPSLSDLSPSSTLQSAAPNETQVGGNHLARLGTVNASESGTGPDVLGPTRLPDLSCYVTQFSDRAVSGTFRRWSRSRPIRVNGSLIGAVVGDLTGNAAHVGNGM